MALETAPLQLSQNKASIWRHHSISRGRVSRQPEQLYFHIDLNSRSHPARVFRSCKLVSRQGTSLRDRQCPALGPHGGHAAHRSAINSFRAKLMRIVDMEG